jgi:hypothetical protein
MAAVPAVPSGLLPSSKGKILRLAASDIGTSGCTLAEGINAFANYFKHRDEWPNDWSSLMGKEKETVRVIRAFGASEGSTGNLRTGLEGMGYPDYNVGSMGEDLQRWYEGTYAHCQSVLQSAGLL